MTRNNRKRIVTDIENIAPAVSKVKWEPENWKLHLDNIKKMRSALDAPVDTMGCERLAQVSADPKTFRLQILLSLMLSSQTKDQITSAAIGRLQIEGCDLTTLRSMNISKLQDLIYPQKAIYIKKTCDILFEKYDSDIPDSVEGLCSLPGVGPKMAYLAMQCAWNKVVGIGVDTHVHRIVNRLNWTPKATKTPEDTRIALEQWLPLQHWRDINWLLVGFGQQRCLPAKPRCDDCLNRLICPIGSKQHKK